MSLYGPHHTLKTEALREKTDPRNAVQSIHCKKTLTLDGQLVSPPGNTEHNLETSGISRSEHFRITASLLGVSVSSHGLFVLLLSCCVVIFGVFTSGAQIVAGRQFDPSLLPDYQRQCGEATQRPGGLQQQGRPGQGRAAVLLRRSTSHKACGTSCIQIIAVDISGNLQQPVCLDCWENQQRHLPTLDRRRQIGLLVHRLAGHLRL